MDPAPGVRSAELRAEQVGCANSLTWVGWVTGFMMNPQNQMRRPATTRVAWTTLPDARITGGIGELSVPDHADIGSELSGELVSQPQTGVGVREPRANVTLGVVHSVEADLDVGLQDEPLRQQQVVLGLEAQAVRPPCPT